jgi:hypothetical protein
MMPTAPATVMRDTSTVAQAMPAIVAVLRPSLFSATEGGLLEENAPKWYTTKSVPYK